MHLKPSRPPLHYGIFSQVFFIEGRIIRKFPEESTYPEDPTITVRNEKVAYRQIGNHARIAQWIPDDADEYIDLVFYPDGNMTDYLDRYKDEIPHHLVVRWGLQIIEAITVIHAREIIHSDLNLKQVCLTKILMPVFLISMRRLAWGSRRLGLKSQLISYRS
ncbi:hypothetical protein AYO20_06617 [Fonsecaea nubica]|uniref:Protein kinase domain-containing protein n=1 Tax=Fonsecaea nubica TaxID=856822 RepID=A0A178CY28_9EURO|nr:hypothetical protein AYO20_06617 [Fonsecaea nubica]OAL34162.1 hypothetical protein AYO20_06617 [Fonsecaea nubica]